MGWTGYIFAFLAKKIPRGTSLGPSLKPTGPLKLTLLCVYLFNTLFSLAPIKVLVIVVHLIQKAVHGLPLLKFDSFQAEQSCS